VKSLENFSPKKGACKICRTTQTKIYAKNNSTKVKLCSKKKHTRNVNFVYQYKLNKICVDCNNQYHPQILHFDHVSNNKIKCVSKMLVSSSIEKIQNEINKCELVCTNCHRHRTFIRSKSQKEFLKKKSKTPTRDKLQKIIFEIKESQPCFVCNKFYKHYQMDFDHIDRETKSHSISYMISYQFSLDEILLETKKCNLLCANCHANRTIIQLNQTKNII